MMIAISVVLVHVSMSVSVVSIIVHIQSTIALRIMTMMMMMSGRREAGNYDKKWKNQLGAIVAVRYQLNKLIVS